MQCAKSLRNYHNLYLIKKVELVIAVRTFDAVIPLAIYIDSVMLWWSILKNQMIKEKVKDKPQK